MLMLAAPVDETDPLKRFNSSGFLLQRTRLWAFVAQRSASSVRS
jgi:hypothetical protein